VKTKVVIGAVAEIVAVAWIVARYKVKVEGETSRHLRDSISDVSAARLASSPWNDESHMWQLSSHANLTAPVGAVCDQESTVANHSGTLGTGELGQCLGEDLGRAFREVGWAAHTDEGFDSEVLSQKPMVVVHWTTETATRADDEQSPITHENCTMTTTYTLNNHRRQRGRIGSVPPADRNSR